MIPKIIHFCWLSEDEYPKLIKKCIESWKAKLPDYDFILWDINKFNVETTIWTKQAYQSKKYAFASDYIRLLAVYTYGGIYLDTDVEVLKTFDDLLTLPYFIGSQYDDLLEAAVFGAEKKSDWLLDCIKYYENRHFIKQDGFFDMLVLPEIMQSQIERNKKIIQLNLEEVRNISKLIENKNSFFLFPSEYFSPKNHQTGIIFITEKTYTIHHYNNAWMSFLSIQRLKLIRRFGLVKAEKIINILKIRQIITLFKGTK
ncbi:glycosyl transferase-like sugar-binding protein [Jejuia pallidilutea]|uniref:Glycosyl transferase-like sugar-binding protein n=1 Tax=Jejuia pallidilutea TaxID=504487 RepID=A0A362X531_9FLAO|nr:glycosyltransferase [Jejuia pallidilutea]PQV50404.1 glycosyl transferase-like sugar-binding protein [Jejuia pallidilutea]